MDNRRQSGLWQQDEATGYYERQAPQGPYNYYQPPPRRSTEDGRRSFSERTGTIPGYGEPFSSSNGPMRQDSRKIRDLTRAASERVTNAGRVDPNYVPNNVRSKPWSPDPAVEKPRQASNASEPMRRGSVPDRSPLQKLELSAKEEKRARVEQAEQRSRQNSVNRGAAMPAQGEMLRAGTLRDSKGRVVSDGSRMPRDGGYYKSSPRQMPADQFRQASEALKYKSNPPLRQEPYVPKQRQEPPPIAQAPRPYHHAPEAPRNLNQAPYADASVQRASSDAQRTGDVQRTASGKYKHRARDAGFVGAGAAAAGAVGLGAYEASSGDRGQNAYDKQKPMENSPVSPISPTDGGLARSESRKLQKRLPADLDPMRGKQALQTDRMGSMGSKKEKRVAEQYLEPDPLPKEQVATGPNDPVSYRIPPQTAAGQQAHALVNETSPERRQRGYGAETSQAHAQAQDKHHRFGDMFHHRDHQQRSYVPSSKPLDDWRNAQVAQLTVSDLEFDRDASAGARDARNDPWWEKDRSRRTSSSGRSGQPPQMDGPYEEEAKQFRPMVFLKCGPLLRYTGIRKEGAREIWRGSVMIVTEDAQSDYSSTPTLRLFAQPAELHQPPPRELLESGQEIPPEFRDPVEGQVKISRTGRPLYVKAVHELQTGVDLSKTENNSGLYSATRAPMLGSQYSAGPDGQQTEHVAFRHKSRIKRKDGEKAGRYKDVKAARLHTERGFTFWRWSIEIELGSTQHRVAYRINRGPALGFWVPARGETMHIMFHSCNGFSMSVNPDEFSGPDPLWRSVMNRHQARPFHVMLGGGDQIYNDAAMRDTELFRDWLQTKNPHEKHGAEFSPEMQEELENFYLNRYAMWFSQGMFAMAGSQIPMVNLWDDHDIIDGFGSYPHHFMSTPVFTGVGAVAFKYYMLFQHQSVVGETAKEEPSWVLGASPGPYIAELSRSVFLSLGRKVAFLGVDCRTERMRDEILSEQTYDILFERCHDEIIKGEVKHLIVLLGVPIAYPRLNFLENILTSRVMDPIKAIGRTGMLGGFVNKFDGGVEILDDLDDHWTAKHHKQERNWFIQELQELAASKSVRITILGGDVHLGAVGQFYTPKKFNVPKDRDHRYMPNVVSSAIVNTPPPPMMADALNKRNKVHHLDDETDEDLIPMFEVDVDDSKRNNKRLLPRRNYCTIREFHPGSTPPPTPPPERMSFDQGDDMPFNEPKERDRRFPPGSMRRTMSLTRGPGKLIRRLSGGGRGKNPPPSLGPEQTRTYGAYDEKDAPAAPGMGRSQSLSGPRPESAGTGRNGADPEPRPGFFRRPTMLTKREVRNAAAKGGAPDEEGDAANGEPEAGHINLDGGLDICLHMEVDQHHPGGATMPYRMLVPALWYDGPADVNTERVKGRGATLMQRLRGRRRKSVDSYESGEGSLSPPPSRAQQDQAQQGQPGGGIAPGGGPGWQPTATGGVRMPTQQQQAQQPRQGYGPFDGAQDALPPSAMAGGANGRRSMDPRPSAYERGFKGSQPPIGGSAQQTPPQPQAHPTFQEPLPQSPTQQDAGRSTGGGGGLGGFFSRRAASNPNPAVSQKHTQFTSGRGLFRRGDGQRYADDEDEGSLTPSEEEFYDPAEEPQGRTPGLAPRRMSKAERFFGIGEPGGRVGGGGGGTYEDAGVEGEGKRRKWQIWK